MRHGPCPPHNGTMRHKPNWGYHWPDPKRGRKPFITINARKAEQRAAKLQARLAQIMRNLEEQP